MERIEKSYFEDIDAFFPRNFAHGNYRNSLSSSAEKSGFTWMSLRRSHRVIPISLVIRILRLVPVLVCRGHVLLERGRQFHNLRQMVLFDLGNDAL